MRSRWSDDDARSHPGPVGERVYSSRLLGAEPALVLHGGGNTSVKLTEPDLFGAPTDVLHVKGSGSDLASMTARDFAPVRLEHLRRLAELDDLGDTEMMEQLRLACTRADAPAPSVEAILHAILPATYVDHTHADAVIAVSNTPNGRKRIEQIYGERVVVIDYVMPGFALARRCAVEFPAQCTEATIGMVLMSHGVFSFGATARESYERMIELVSMAEDHLKANDAWELPERDLRGNLSIRNDLADLRADVSRAAGAPMILTATSTPRINAFLSRHDHADLATRGPLTPDHAIRTKRIPLVGRDVAAYAHAYERYFEGNAGRRPGRLTMLDSAPRVVLDPGLGLITAGRTAGQALIARDVAEHTLDTIERAAALDDWQALPEGDIFDVEYWELEQAKLAKSASPPPLTGDVALVTGAASGIGRATVDRLRTAGAAVVGFDLDAAIVDLVDDSAVLGVQGDVTDEGAVEAALECTVRQFGGLDILVLNAGIFPPSARIDTLSGDAWRKVMAVNVDANLTLLRLSGSLLARSPRYGRVVVNASKNVAAPGPGAAAYSASKAALTQLARVAALEWASRGVRVNLVHPNAVFDTGIWDDATIAARAATYGLTVAEYRTNSLLGVEITSADVAEMIAALCSPAFAKTTGAQVPVDGGNERVV